MRASGRGLLDPDAVAFLQSGVATGVATRDDDLRPAFTRAFGPEVSEDGRRVTICVIAPPGSRTRENLESNGAIAIVFNPPTAGQALQIKGAVIEVHEPEDIDVERAEAHLEAFVAQAAQLGVPPSNVRRALMRPDLLAVTFSLDAAFDQTPGQRAGTPL
jgi:hypothetical protein